MTADPGTVIAILELALRVWCKAASMSSSAKLDEETKRLETGPLGAWEAACVAWLQHLHGQGPDGQQLLFHLLGNEAEEDILRERMQILTQLQAALYVPLISNANPLENTRISKAAFVSLMPGEDARACQLAESFVERMPGLLLQETHERPQAALWVLLSQNQRANTTGDIGGGPLSTRSEFHLEQNGERVAQTTSVLTQTGLRTDLRGAAHGTDLTPRDTTGPQLAETAAAYSSEFDAALQKDVEAHSLTVADDRAGDCGSSASSHTTQSSPVVELGVLISRLSGLGPEDSPAKDIASAGRLLKEESDHLSRQVVAEAYGLMAHALVQFHSGAGTLTEDVLEEARLYVQGAREAIEEQQE